MNTNRNSQVNDELTKLTRKQTEKLKRYAIYAVMALIFAGCMYWIFSPSKDGKANKEAQTGFNTEIPDPKEEGLIGDKRSAYEQEQMKQKQSERMRTLQDFSALITDNTPKTDELALITDEPPETGQSAVYGSSSGSGSRTQSSITNSVAAYQDVNRSLGNFYERPREDPEKERLKREVEELKTQMEEAQNRNSSMDNQLDLMEKSFEMASRYMPGLSGTGTTAVPLGNTANPSAASATSEAGNGNVSSNFSAMQVSGVQEQTVSTLQNDISDTEFIEMFAQPRNLGFLTATGTSNTVQKNTFSACIHNDQRVMSGQNVRLRLLENLKAGNILIPRNTLLTGMAKIQGERLDITVSFMETDGTVLPVSLTVFDLDGQNGIFIPDMQELNATKEIIANMGSNAGTSVNLSTDASQQFVADMGRNIIQGVSQFTSKKLREVKVHLKAGYRIYLIPDGSLKEKTQPQLANR